jgi:hypothetical protein
MSYPKNSLGKLRLSSLLLVAVVSATACAPKQPPQGPLVLTNNPSWAETTIRVTGRGAYPQDASGAQARLMAERAARTDAYRKITEQVYGLELRSGTLVRDAVLANDEIEVSVRGFVRGAQVVDTRNRPNLGIVEIDMEVFLGEDFQRFVFR